MNISSLFFSFKWKKIEQCFPLHFLYFIPEASFPFPLGYHLSLADASFINPLTVAVASSFPEFSVLLTGKLLFMSYIIWSYL